MRQEECPIGLDDSPEFCSAGYCDRCRFERWYEENEVVFHQSHMDEKQIAFSAFIKGLEDGEL